MIVARLTIILFLFANVLCAQSDGTHYSISYSLFRSAQSNYNSENFRASLGSSLFANVEMGRKESLKYTMGIGLLQSNIIFMDYTGMQGYADEERHYSLKYFVIPAGMKFVIGSFFIHPEIAASFNYRVTSKSYLVDADRNKQGGIYAEDQHSRSLEPYLSSFITLGYEFKIGSLTMISGVNGYFVLDPHWFNTYGVGLLFGVKI